MPFFKIPCWIPTTHDFDVVIEAKDTDSAFNKLIDMVHSSDPETMDYIENCINAGSSTGIGENAIDFYRDVLNVQELTSEQAHEFNLSLRPSKFDEASDGC